MPPLAEAPAHARFVDCNDNDVDDAQDISAGTSTDCNLNTVPDECDLSEPSAFDCNVNALVDSCEIAAGTSPDCNLNAQPDDCDLIENDCDNNDVPDDCQPDCDDDNTADACAILFGFDTDCNLNAIPDQCDLAAGTTTDLDENGVPDGCVIWISTTGLWSESQRWEPMLVPDNTPTDKFFVTIDNFAADVTLDIDAEIQGLTLGLGFGLRGDGTPRLNLTQGNLTIESPRGVQLDGILTVGSGFSLIAGETFGIRGTAPVNLEGATAQIVSREDGDRMTSRTGVRGFGRISADFINESTVSADVAETTMVISGPGRKVNNGLFEAFGGARLLITEPAPGRALAITGTGDYEARFAGDIQLGEGGPAVNVSGHDLRLFAGGRITMVSPWTLLLTGQVLVAGGVFDPDTGSSGLLSVPVVRVTEGTMNLGASTVADIGQLIVGFEFDLREAAVDRGLTPPVLNIGGGGKANSGSATIGEGAETNVFESGELNVSGPITVGVDTTRAALGLTPPILNVKGDGKATAGAVDIPSGVVVVEENGSLDSAGPVSVGNGEVLLATRGLTPPVLNVAGGGKTSATALQVNDGGTVLLSDQSQTSTQGNAQLGDGTTRGLTPPVLNMSGAARLDADGDFAILTTADITVGAGNNVSVGGNFQNESTSPQMFNWDQGQLTMDGGAARGTQTLEVGGENRGQLSLAGFNLNFSFGVLEIGSNAIVTIVDLFDNQEDGVSECDESAYVDVLIMQPGSQLLAGECKLYFKTLINNGGSIPELGSQVIPIGGGDVDSNGVIDALDFDAFLAAFGSCAGDAAYIAGADLDFDGCITLVDYQLWYGLYQEATAPRRAAAPETRNAQVTVRVEPAVSVVESGDVFTVALVADIVPPVLGWGLDLTITAPGVLSLAGSPQIGGPWLAAAGSDGDGLAALAFPASVSGTGIVLATVPVVATGLGSSSLVPAVTAGDLAEGFALEPAGFADVAFTSAAVTVLPRSSASDRCDAVDVGMALTANQPTYWSAAIGKPANTGDGITPFVILEPGPPPGRLATDGSNERVLQGFIVAWAVNASGQEIRWNHLAGAATLVNYARGSAWEYTAHAFRIVDPALGNGDASGSPGALLLDGAEFDNAYDLLLFDFYAANDQPPGPLPVVDTELTLMPIAHDLRQESSGSVTTKASFIIWNQNEVKLTGLDRCLTCWDQALLSQYGAPNHFLRTNLQTDKGKAQIDGLQSALCDLDYEVGDGLPLGDDPRDVVSQNAALIGVAVRHLVFGANGPYESAGANLAGMGTQSAAVLYDPSGGPPPERPAPRALFPAGATGALVAPQSTLDGARPEPNPLAATDRTSASQKGSLLVFPKIELRWNAAGDVLLQDTFINLVNDYPADVQVQMYFVSGG